MPPKPRKTPAAVLLHLIRQTTKIIGLAVVVATAIFAFQYDWGAVWVDPVSEPIRLQLSGYSSEILQDHLVDRAKTLRRLSKTMREEIRFVQPDVSDAAVTILSKRISLRSYIYLTFYQLDKNRKNISGEIVVSDAGAGKPYRLILREKGNEQIPFFDEEGELENLIKDGALAILTKVDPNSAGSYLVVAGDEDRGGAGTNDAKRLMAEADRQAKKAESNKKNSEWVEFLNGRAKQATHDYASAIALFDRANASYAENHSGAAWPLALDAKGAALIAGGKPEEAEVFLRQQLATFKDSPALTYHLGLAQDRQHRYCEAYSTLQKALSLGSGPANDAIGNLLLEVSNLEVVPDCFGSVSRTDLDQQAIERFQAALAIDPLHAPTYVQYGIALLQLKDYGGAAGKFAQANLLYDQDAYAWWRLADAEDQLTDTVQGLKSIEYRCKSVRIDPEYKKHLDIYLSDKHLNYACPA